MGIIIFTILSLVVLRVEYTLRLRTKYQTFSSRFTKYYIDFIVLLLILAVISVFIYLLSLISFPIFLIYYILIFAMLYSLFIILPIKSFDEFLKKIFNE